MMYTNSSFGKNIDLLQRCMGVNTMRQEVIANNIANSDTPNYKRQTVNFETSLKNALDSETAERFPTKVSDPRHLEFDRPVDYRSVNPRRVTDWLTQSKNNGNNVDIEEETSLAVNAQLSYNLMVQEVMGEFNNLNVVLRR